MKTAVRLCLLVSVVSFFSLSASAELNQDWQSPDGSGDGCWLCDDDFRCVKASSGAKGLTDCSSGQICNSNGCVEPHCVRSGDSCTGTSALRLEWMWMIPDGEPFLPIVESPPVTVVEDVGPCA